MPPHLAGKLPSEIRSASWLAVGIEGAGIWSQETHVAIATSSLSSDPSWISTGCEQIYKIRIIKPSYNCTFTYLFWSFLQAFLQDQTPDEPNLLVSRRSWLCIALIIWPWWHHHEVLPLPFRCRFSSNTSWERVQQVPICDCFKGIPLCSLANARLWLT